MNYSEERSALFMNYLNKGTFNPWKTYNPFETYFDSRPSLELFLTPVCNTACTYCYLNNFMDDLYPREFRDKETLIENTKKIAKWLKVNHFRPGELEIFSGEFLNLPFYREILDILNDALDYSTPLIIPTNCTFCLSDKKLQEVEDLLVDFKGSHLDICLSLSDDGKYLGNTTRPLRNGKLYDDEYYHRLFSFANKHNYSFHPMISAAGIKDWIKNYDWFINSIVKYDKQDMSLKEKRLCAVKKIYLLEVRNADWTFENLKDLFRFSEHSIELAFDACDRNPEKFIKNFVTDKGGNWVAGFINRSDKGLPCSLPTTFTIRVGDLAIVPCHRTGYRGYEAGFLNLDDPKNFKIDIINPENFMLTREFDCGNIYPCIDCSIKPFCTFFCLGNNYEVNKDFFLPVKNVCDLEKTKIYSIIYTFQKLGVLKDVLKLFEGPGLEKKKSIIENILIESKKFLNLGDKNGI